MKTNNKYFIEQFSNKLYLDLVNNMGFKNITVSTFECDNNPFENLLIDLKYKTIERVTDPNTDFIKISEDDFLKFIIKQ